MAKKIAIYITLIACCIPLFYLHIYDVHSWGDDFAQYIKEALNIAQGKPYYQADYIFNPLNPEYGPPQYPAGFPLLLAPIVKIWGLSFKPMFFFISACLAALIVVLYHFFKHHTQHTIPAICLAVICVYSGGVLELKANILSDIPCWLFTALYITMRQQETKNNLRIIAIIMVGVMAILIRSQALLLLVAEGLYLFQFAIRDIWDSKRINLKTITNTTSFKIISAVSVLFLLLNYIVFAAPNSGLSYYGNLIQYHSGDWYTAILNNAHYLFILLVRTFQYYPWEENILKFTTALIPYGIFTLSVLGYIKSLKKKSTYEAIYFTISIILLLVLSQKQGIRFILPILPIFLLYAYIAVKNIFPNTSIITGSLAAVLFTTIYFLAGYDDFRLAYKEPPENYIPTANDRKAFNYIRQHLTKSDAIIFAKPRLLSLMTERKSITPAIQRTIQENKIQFDKVGVNYALFNSDVKDDFTRKYLEELNLNNDSIIIADGYVLYKLEVISYDN